MEDHHLRGLGVRVIAHARNPAGIYKDLSSAPVSHVRRTAAPVRPVTSITPFTGARQSHRTRPASAETISRALRATTYLIYRLTGDKSEKSGTECLDFSSVLADQARR
jgi:hypothetical protein